jgi:hypothetical protein
MRRNLEYRDGLASERRDSLAVVPAGAVGRATASLIVTVVGARMPSLSSPKPGAARPSEALSARPEGASARAPDGPPSVPVITTAVPTFA